MKRMFTSPVRYVAAAAAVVLWVAGSAFPVPQASVDGKWIVPDGVGYAPWTFDLKVDGSVVTGVVSMSLGGPMPISNGTVDGNTVAFKVTSSEGARTVTFVGKVDGNALSFTRDVVVNFQAGGGNGIVGTSGVREFAARRVSATSSPLAAANSPRTTGLDGRWQATGVPGGPWTFEFAITGAQLGGTVQQSGFPTNPVSIAGGRVDGPGLSFKVLSPDAERIVTFSGRLHGNEVSLIREVTPLSGGGRGGGDLYGVLAPAEFVARRIGANRFNFKGVNVDVAFIESLPNHEAILEALRKQIDIVDAAVADPVQRTFLKSVPLVMSPSAGTAPNNAGYSGNTRSVTLQSQPYDADKPVILHELMHAYHDQKLSNGFANADIQRLFQQARTGGRFPADSYVLSNVAEYFAMIASVYLHGSEARDPFTRETIKEKQPDCYDWLVKEFGPR